MSRTTPRGRPAASGVAVVLALVLIALAVVGVHELFVAQRWAGGSSWLQPLNRGLDGVAAGVVPAVVGVVVALIGLWLVVVSLSPARRTHDRAPVEQADVWISRRAVGRLARLAAENTPGVNRATVAPGGRTVTVRAALTTADGAVPDRVRERVARSLEGFSSARVKVKVSEVRHDA